MAKENFHHYVPAASAVDGYFIFHLLKYPPCCCSHSVPRGITHLHVPTRTVDRYNKLRTRTFNNIETQALRSSTTKGFFNSTTSPFQSNFLEKFKEISIRLVPLLNTVTARMKRYSLPTYSTCPCMPLFAPPPRLKVDNLSS